MKTIYQKKKKKTIHGIYFMLFIKYKNLALALS